MAKILVEEVLMLRNVAIIEVLYPKIDKYLKYIGKIEQCKINAVVSCAHLILHRSINTEYKKRLDEQIDRYQKNDVEDKTTLQRD